MIFSFKDLSRCPLSSNSTYKGKDDGCFSIEGGDVYQFCEIDPIYGMTERDMHMTKHGIPYLILFVQKEW